MDFYSFSFGDMQVAQADASSPEIVAMDVRLAFRDSETKGAHLLTVQVQVPGGADSTIADVQQEAFEKMLQILQAATAYCQGKTPNQLKEASEKQLISTSKTP
jgi:hypothetical protein